MEFIFGLIPSPVLPDLIWNSYESRKNDIRFICLQLQVQFVFQDIEKPYKILLAILRDERTIAL